MNSHKRAQTHTDNSSEMDGMSSSKDFKRSRSKNSCGLENKKSKNKKKKDKKTM